MASHHPLIAFIADLKIGVLNELRSGDCSLESQVF